LTKNQTQAIKVGREINQEDMMIEIIIEQEDITVGDLPMVAEVDDLALPRDG
jgi:hypothetical protein